MPSKSISKSVLWQLSGKFALQGIAFFTTPIFTRLLTSADYGYAALYASWLSILCLIVGLQVGGSTGNARLEYGEDKLPEYLSSIMTVSLFSFIIILLIAIIFHNWLSNILGIAPHLVVLVVIQSFCAFVINFEVGRLDQLKKVEKSTLLSLLQSVFVITLSLFFVINTKNNKAIAKIYGQAIPVILLGSVIFILVYIRGKSFWNTKYIKFCLSLTLPLIVHGIGHLIFSQSDRIMLQKMHGEDVLGIYSVTFNLCAVLTIIYGATNVSWIPFYFDFKKQNKKEEILAHSRRYLKFYTLISIGFILLSYDVYKIMAPSEYYDGMKIIPLFVLSNFFSFIYLFPVNYEFYEKKTKLIPVATFTAALINIAINWLLIPNYGLLGAAIGTLVAHFLLYVFHEIMACIIGKEEYEYRRIMMFVFPTFVLTIISVFFFFAQPVIFWLRWLMAILIGIWILKDLLKYRSIF